MYDIKFEKLPIEQSTNNDIKELINKINADLKDVEFVSADKDNKIGYMLKIAKDNLDIDLVVRCNKELSTVDSLMSYASCSTNGIKYDYCVRFIPGSDFVEHIIVKSDGVKHNKKVFKYKIGKGLTAEWLKEVLAQIERFSKQPSSVYREISTTTDGLVKRFVDNIGVSLGEATLDTSVSGSSYTYSASRISGEQVKETILTIDDNIMLTMEMSGESYLLKTDNRLSADGKLLGCTISASKTLEDDNEVILSMELNDGRELGIELIRYIMGKGSEPLTFDKHMASFDDMLNIIRDFMDDPLSVAAKFQDGSYTTQSIKQVIPEPISIFSHRNKK